MQIQDSLTLAAVVAELQRLCTGARIDRIHLPTAHEMVWNLRGEGKNLRLLFSIRGNYARLHLTQRRYENPAQPPMFCMLLRKHLEGSRILRIEQLELERVVQIVTAGRDELGDPTERALVAEITGKHANLILLDKPWGTVMGSLRTVTEAVSRERQIMPGLPYDPPPISQAKLDPRRLAPGALWGVLAKGGTAEGAILSGVHSLSRAAIAQLLVAAGIDPKVKADTLDAEALSRLEMVWQTAMDHLAEGRFRPELNAGPGWEYRVLPVGAEPTPEVSVCDMLDAYYGSRETSERLDNQRSQLSNLVKERLDKLRTRRVGLVETVAVGRQAEELRQWGELIQAYGYGLPARSTELVAENYYLEGSPRVTIPLDPRLTPMENAQRYFRRYQKAKGGLETSERFLAEVDADLTYWEGVETSIRLSDRLEELFEIRAEIQPAPAHKQPKKQAPVTEPMRFMSSDGLEILVGKNNRQNDQLSMKLARQDDWWFHTQNIPGSHVLVRSAGGALPDRTRDEAALLAAYYSQARESSKVPVIFTQRRHLKKPSGAKPGLVIYEREKAVFVTPEPGAIAAIARGDA
jgi:predicted ribosome quality control (RQC) complex YloA/Tae2 family protein